MDFLDPVKQRNHRIMLFIGYGLIAIAVSLATIILVYVVYGFGLDRNGQVVQNGLVFFSSAPEGGSIYLNNKVLKEKTNTRAVLPAGQYSVRIARDGYDTWQRSITVEGSSVAHFDYPFLFPTKLKTSVVKSLEGSVDFAAQSPNKRWLVISQPEKPQAFYEFDLKNPDKPAKTLSLPDGVLNPTTEGRTLQLIGWADNNTHLLLKHSFTGGSEYILLNRSKPEESVNLSQKLNLTTQSVNLFDRKYDQFYIYDQPTLTLSRASLEDVRPDQILTNVLSYKSYGSDMVLFVSPVKTMSSQNPVVQVGLYADETTYKIRTIPADSSYLLDLNRYDGDWIIAAGAPKEGRVYVYQDPLDDLKARPNEPVVPLHVLKVTTPSIISFSANARFIAAQNKQDFYVYDAENDKGYLYDSKVPMDSPQTAATWMDGHRLQVVSAGKLTVFDFDATNVRSLMNADARFAPFYDPNFKRAYVFGQEDGNTRLTVTPLVTEQDL